MSCDKNDYNDYIDPVNVKLLETETSGKFHMRKFFYDDQNRIKEMWTFSGGELFEKAHLTYTGEDLTKFEYAYLVDGEFVVMDTRNYVKNGNKISWSINTLTLNNDGFPIKLEEVFFNTPLVSTFTYVRGNLVKYSYDTMFSSLSNDPGERNYKYGADRSAYSGCKTPKWFMFLYFFEMASHNAVKTKSNPDATYSYEFDSDGFPIKYTQFGTEDITEFKYMK